MFSINSHKDTNINQDIFSIKTKETRSEAVNTSFYKNFFKANRTTKTLGVFGQILSAITEFIFVFKMVGGDFKNSLFTGSNLIGIIIGAVAVFVFEVLGVRVYLVRVVRQIVNKEFKTGSEIALFVFNILLVGSILTGSFYTSLTGQNTTIKTAKHSDNSALHDSLDSKLDKKLLAIDSVANGQLVHYKKESKEVIENINKIYSNTQKNLTRSKWATGANVASLNSKIIKSDNEKISKIEAVRSDLKDDLKAINSRVEKDKERARAAHAKQIKALNKNESHNASIYDLYDSYSFYLLIIFMSLSFLSVIYDEIYALGSGQKTELSEVKKRPVLFSVLVYGLYMKIYHYWYKKVVKWIGIQAFNYSKVMQKKEDFLSNSLFDDLELNTSAYEALNGTNMQIQMNAAKPSALQEVRQNANSENDVLGEYKITTIQSWFKRSDLVANSLSSKVETQKKNTKKYEAVKAELSEKGVIFLESKNNVVIKV